MFLIASLLLNSGLLICFNLGNFFNKTAKELNASDIYYIMPSSLYSEEIDQYLTENGNIVKLQKEAPYYASATYQYKGDKRERVFLFNDADHARNMTKWKFIGKYLPEEDMSIYLPYLFKLQGGYHLNDKFELVFSDKKIEFTIKGFIEDIYFSSPETGLMGTYLPHATYEKVIKKLGESCKATLVFANLKEINNDIENGLNDKLNIDNASDQADITKSLFSMDLSMVKLSRTIMANMISIMIVAFAAIILLVCLIVVRFRINNSIEDDMIKIGSLKAIGYTSRQIMASIILQFVLIAFVGSVFGITLSYLSIPSLSSIFAQQSGLMWTQGFDAFISSVAIFVILAIVAFVAFASARRIKKLHPIIALRGGIATHSFQKNHLPLDQSKGSLPFLFAFKSILQNKKQSIMITIILLTVSFAQTFSVIMFYNTTVDPKAFYETPGVELSNAIAVFRPNTDQKPIVEKIKKMKEVRKVQYVDQTTAEVDNNEVGLYVMKDYSKKETNTVYKGRYPIHSNEIVLAGHLAKMLGKSVGDNVVVKAGDKEATFLITGLSQGAYMGGMNSSITYDGIMKLIPDFKQQNLNIYLNKGENAGDYVKKIEKQFNGAFAYTENVDKSMEIGAGIYISIVSKVGIAILAITIAVVILVLYFVINSTVVRKKRELGIQKAIGFTTLQLMNQLSMSFLPSIIVGVFIGSLTGGTQTNAIMSIAQSGMGVAKANYIITPVFIALFGLGIVIISYITSMLITFRIRKISAYSLVSE
jgi:ABC-type transport system, involved in lipoprotein release, permease component